MIVFFAPGGRLGNILFQLSYLLTIRKADERIFTTQLHDVFSLIKKPRKIYNSNNRLMVAIVDLILDPILFHVLARFRIVGTVFEDNGEIKCTRGLLNVRYVKGYFQSDVFANKVQNGISIRNHLKAMAQDIVHRHAGDRVPVFVHVRRGDYLTWIVQGKYAPLLPLSYYRHAIQNLQTRYGNLHFFLLGDDPQWYRDNFSDIKNATISDNTAGVDLSLMSHCQGGIISNSSFAWWGAALCNKNLPVIGPMFWFAWQSGHWYPSGMETPWIEYIQIDKQA